MRAGEIRAVTAARAVAAAWGVIAARTAAERVVAGACVRRAPARPGAAAGGR